MAKTVKERVKEKASNKLPKVEKKEVPVPTEDFHKEIIADNAKQLEGVVAGLNSVVASVNSVRDSIIDLTSITKGMMDIQNASFDFTKKEDKEDEEAAKVASAKAREESLESGDKEPSWVDKLKEFLKGAGGKVKEKVTDQSFVEGLVMTVAGLATVFRDEIANAVKAIGEFGDRVLEGFNSTMNPFIETEEEIADSAQEARQDIIQGLKEGKAATTDELRELAKATEKQKRIAEAKEKGEDFSVDDIHEAVEEEFDKLNRTQLEEKLRANQANQAIFAAQDMAAVERLEEAIKAQQDLLANPDYDGPDWMNTEEDKQRWFERERKELEQMQQALGAAQDKLAESTKNLSQEQLDVLKQDDMQLQQMLERQKKLQESMKQSEESGKTEGPLYNSVKGQLEQLNKSIAEIEGKYDKMGAGAAIKQSTDLLGKPNDAVQVSPETPTTKEPPAPAKPSSLDEGATVGLGTPLPEVQVATPPPSAGKAGEALNAKSKIIDASKQQVIAPTSVNAPTTNNVTNNNVNNSKTTMMPPSASKPNQRVAPLTRGSNYR